MTTSPTEKSKSNEISQVAMDCDISAAALIDRVSVVLLAAVEESGFTPSEVAERMGVSLSRISQIVGEPSNLRLTTIARFLGAIGFEPQFSAKDQQRGTVIDGFRRNRRPRPGTRGIAHVFVPSGTRSGSSDFRDQTFLVTTAAKPRTDVDWSYASTKEFYRFDSPREVNSSSKEIQAWITP